MTEADDRINLSDDGKRQRILNRLRRLEGQVRGLQSMIESNKECEAVLTQVMAAKSALTQVGMHVIGHAMKTCLVEDSLTDRDAIISAAFDVYLQYRELSCTSDISAPAGVASSDEIVALLSRLEGEVRAVQTVMSENGNCADALQAQTAATATLNAVGLAVLGHAMQECLIDDSASSRDEVIDSAIAVFLRYSSCVS
jgi:DNA-binding FrmR family transcriptional regulator